MTPTTNTLRLQQSRHLTSVGRVQLPSYFPESHLELADYVFCRENVDWGDLYIIVREHSTMVAEVRLFVDTGDLQNGIKLYSMSDDGGNGIGDVTRFLTSDYLYNPKLEYNVSLMGYDPDSGLCYMLEKSEIKSVNPEKKSSFAFQGYSREYGSGPNPHFDFEFDLKAILELSKGRNRYGYVFSDVVIEVNARRQTNSLTPLVYEGAWKDYIEFTDAELVTAEGEYAMELVTQNI